MDVVLDCSMFDSTAVRVADLCHLSALLTGPPPADRDGQVRWREWIRGIRAHAGGRLEVLVRVAGEDPSRVSGVANRVAECDVEDVGLAVRLGCRNGQALGVLAEAGIPIAAVETVSAGEVDAIASARRIGARWEVVDLGRLAIGARTAEDARLLVTGVSSVEALRTAQRRQRRSLGGPHSAIALTPKMLVLALGMAEVDRAAEGLLDSWRYVFLESA